jgi:PAS domain S-box-containing protein/diguanylate cyclase (GGDEF)-like protein
MDADQMRLNRELRMLSSCTGALVRAENELDLLHEICRLIVEVGGYRGAWVGYAEHDELCSVRPVAAVNVDVEHLRGLGLSWADTPLGHGPIGCAIRERRIHIAHDVSIDPVLSNWHGPRERGVASIVALPLIVGNECIGALDVYSGRANSFDVSETALLRALATDLAYGIGALRTRVENQQAQRKLALFRALLDRTNDMIYAVEADTARLIDANDALAQRLGYTREELLQMHVPEFSLTARERPWAEAVQSAKLAGFTLDPSALYIDRAGKVHPVELGRSYVEHDEHPYILIVSRDISERKRQEEQIARLTRTLRMQGAINAAILRIADRDELLQEACRIATNLGGYSVAVVSLVEPDGKHARPMFRVGRPRGRGSSPVVEIGDGSTPDTTLGGRALRTGQVTVCSDLTRSDAPVSMREVLYEEGIRSVMALPLIVDGVRIGVLTMTSLDEAMMSDDELLLLQEITASLSFALRSQQQADTVRYLTHFDPLTGLAKRALFCERMESLLNTSFGPRGTPAVVAISVRELSRIADRLGGHYGDLLLKELAERLRHHAENEDRIGYLGAGVFALAEVGGSHSADDLATFLDNALFGAPFHVDGRIVRATGRYGIARGTSDTEDAYALLQRAEAALRQSREADTDDLGYAVEVHSTISDRLAYEHMLRRAIDARQLELHYLPQLDLATGRIDSVEALLRWNEPERGLLLPAQFLPALEASGLIDNVGQWVLQRAIDDGIRWQALGLSPVRIAVNVSSLQVRRRAFVEHCLQLLDRWRVRQGFGIDIEVTESAILRNVEGVSAKLAELRAAGVRVTLDDFGTGYCSLGLLAKLPLDMVKIDRSVIARLPSDPQARALTTSILGVAASLGLMTVAEGVERHDQLAALRALNCQQWQGYLYCPPIPADELEKLLDAPGA